MPLHPPSARGVHFQPEPEDSLEYWRRRAQSAERDLADAQRAENDRREEAEDIAAARDRHIDQRVDAAVAKALADRLTPTPPISYPQPPFVPQPLNVPTPSPYGYPPMMPGGELPPMGGRMSPAPYIAGLPPMRLPTPTTPDVLAYAEERKRERVWSFAKVAAIPFFAFLTAVVGATVSHCDKASIPPPALPPPFRATTAPH